MSKQLCHVAQFVGFQPMNGTVLLRKGVHKGIPPSIINKAEPGRN